MDKVNFLVAEGVRDVSEMRRHVNVFVKNNLFQGMTPPPTTNKRFYPSAATVKNHMYNAVVKQRLSKIDQANLNEKIKLWKAQYKDDLFEFRPYLSPSESTVHEEGVDCGEDLKVDDGTSDKGLLFVHQTKWQRRLLVRYGNELCLLDATYRTTKYSLPLYFLVVKTNHEYKVVASFVTQTETTASIKEALNILKKWNPTWDPRHFMVDYAEEEISAVEELFPSKFE